MEAPTRRRARRPKPVDLLVPLLVIALGAMTACAATAEAPAIQRLHCSKTACTLGFGGGGHERIQFEGDSIFWLAARKIVTHWQSDDVALNAWIGTTTQVEED